MPMGIIEESVISPIRLTSQAPSSNSLVVVSAQAQVAMRFIGHDVVVAEISGAYLCNSIGHA